MGPVTGVDGPFHSCSPRVYWRIPSISVLTKSSLEPPKPGADFELPCVETTSPSSELANAATKVLAFVGSDFIFFSNSYCARPFVSPLMCVVSFENCVGCVENQLIIPTG